MKSYVFLAGIIEDYSFFDKYLKCNDFIKGKITVICADGGYRHAKILDIKPNCVVGDFDSIEEKEVETINIIKYPRGKDYTDGRLAVEHAFSLGCTHLSIFGALGMRFDHTMGNICLLKTILNKGAYGEIADGKNRIFLADKYMKLKRDDFRYISFFPLDERAEGITLTGLKYPLQNATLLKEDSIAISNEFEDETAYVEVKNGILLVVQST